MTPDASFTGILQLAGQLAGLVIVVWLFIKQINEQRTEFMQALKDQRDECNADRALDRADRAESRREYLASFERGMGDMRAGLGDVREGLGELAKEIRK